MTWSSTAAYPGVDARARQSLGTSSDAIHQMVAAALQRHDIKGMKVFDVGCGHGALHAAVRERFVDYHGIDAVRYSGFPEGATFTRIDLDAADWPDTHYPAHRTALLESDLCRITEACGLDLLEIGYSIQGRIPLTGGHYPAAMSRRWPRALSDNLMIVAKKPVG